MCLIVVAHRVSCQWPLVVVANRDEFHARPAAALDIWADDEGIAAGRDQLAGGTWLAAMPNGDFAALTNARVPGPRRTWPQSRGHLVIDTLMHGAAGKINNEQFAPFSLLLLRGSTLIHQSNWFPSVGAIAPGIHALSNGAMNAGWPKAVAAIEGLRTLLAREQVSDSALLEMMRNQPVDPDVPLPDTGVGAELEQRLAPVFLSDPIYGTRCTTVLMRREDGMVTMVERRYTNQSEIDGDTRLLSDGRRWSNA